MKDKSFKDFLDMKEERLDEDATEIIANVLGYGTVGLAVAWGASLITRGYMSVFKKTKSAMKNFNKDVNVEATIKKMKATPAIKVIKVEDDKIEKAYGSEFDKVFKGIEEQNIQLATEGLNDIKVTPPTVRILINKITISFGAPPIHFGNTGNDTYLFVKKLLGIKEAKESAKVVAAALEKYSFDKLTDEKKDY